MTLSDWCDNHWIVDYQSTRDEITDLLSVVDRDLGDAALPNLSPDWRLGISYNAALQLATLALAAEGFRPGRERAHERAILSLRVTVGVSCETVDFCRPVLSRWTIAPGVRRSRPTLPRSIRHGSGVRIDEAPGQPRADRQLG